MNKLHVYLGGGKGKTTAAMGLALRMLGHRQTVLIAQFMKNGESGELFALRFFREARVLPAPPMGKFTFQMTEEEFSKASLEQTNYIFSLFEEIDTFKPRLIVLDELAAALTVGLIPRNNAEKLINLALSYGETAVTGYDCPDWLKARADYLTLLTSLRHPFETEGLEARKGIEW